jgi:nitrite reductase/ring-hydroxylating ferredoxin subunit
VAGSHRFLLNDHVYAIRDLCPHQGALLSEGAAYAQPGGPIVLCPVHWWSFSLIDGKATSDPCYQAVVYETKVEDGKVLVRLAQS